MRGKKKGWGGGGESNWEKEGCMRRLEQEGFQRQNKL